MSNRRRLGILGGTFDPIHLGHLFIAEAARDALSLDEVIFIPTGDPPHKKDHKIASAKYRVQLINLAIKSNEKFSLDTLEVDRKGTTYIIDTLKGIKTKYPSDKLLFIIGGDTLLELKKWKSFQDVSDLCDFIVYQRLGIDDKIMKYEAEILKNMYNTLVYFVYGPNIDISSSDIRKRIQRNQTIKYLVPDCVELAIREWQLYKGVF